MMTNYTMKRKEWALAANCVEHFFNNIALAYALDRQCWPFEWDQPITIPLDQDAEGYILCALTEDYIECQEDEE